MWKFCLNSAGECLFEFIDLFTGSYTFDKKLVNKNEELHLIGRNKALVNCVDMKLIKAYDFFFFEFLSVQHIRRRLPFYGVTFCFTVEVYFIR